MSKYNTRPVQQGVGQGPAKRKVYLADLKLDTYTFLVECMSHAQDNNDWAVKC